MLNYTSCGLKNVRLRNGYEATETAYGKAVSIHDLEGLHRTIGLHIVRHNPELLNGDEIRFLRKELDLPQAQLARILDVTEPTVRNWEAGRNRISGPADRLLRTLYMESAQEGSLVRELLETLSQINRDAYASNTLELEETEGGWRATGAA